jgi:hypothetical protein
MLNGWTSNIVDGRWEGIWISTLAEGAREFSRILKGMRSTGHTSH